MYFMDIGPVWVPRSLAHSRFLRPAPQEFEYLLTYWNFKTQVGGLYYLSPTFNLSFVPVNVVNFKLARKL